MSRGPGLQVLALVAVLGLAASVCYGAENDDGVASYHIKGAPNLPVAEKVQPGTSEGLLKDRVSNFMKKFLDNKAAEASTPQQKTTETAHRAEAVASRVPSKVNDVDMAESTRITPPGFNEDEYAGVEGVPGVSAGTDQMASAQWGGKEYEEASDVHLDRVAHSYWSRVSNTALGRLNGTPSSGVPENVSMYPSHTTEHPGPVLEYMSNSAQSIMIHQPNMASQMEKGWGVKTANDGTPLAPGANVAKENCNKNCGKSCAEKCTENDRVNAACASKCNLSCFMECYL